MSGPFLKARVDANQPEIVAALKAIGATVAYTHQVGHGFGDIVIGFRGNNYLIEIKVPGGKLNANEKEFSDNWLGQYDIAETIDDALRIIGAI